MDFLFEKKMASVEVYIPFKSFKNSSVSQQLLVNFSKIIELIQNDFFVLGDSMEYNSKNPNVIGIRGK